MSEQARIVAIQLAERICEGAKYPTEHAKFDAVLQLAEKCASWIEAAEAKGAPDYADELREALERIIQGEDLNTIARDLKSRRGEHA